MDQHVQTIRALIAALKRDGWNDSRERTTLLRAAEKACDAIREPSTAQ